MKPVWLFLALPTALIASSCASPATPGAPVAVSSKAAALGPVQDDAPVFAADNELARPEKYREWIFLSSGLDMSYSEKPDAMTHSMFDNVFVNPAAWRAFQRSGHWPEQTLLVMEVRGGESKGSINRRGHFQGAEVMGLEVHVRDTARFKDGWAFYAFDSPQPAKPIPVSASCYSCHQAHAAVDTTFVQFYPTLLPVARRFGTVSSDEKRP